MDPVTFRIIINNRYRRSYDSDEPWSGKKRFQNSEEALEKYKEDATKAGYNDVGEYFKDRDNKNPLHLRIYSRLYRECAEKHGAESTECKNYKKHWLECKAAQNA